MKKNIIIAILMTIVVGAVIAIKINNAPMTAVESIADGIKSRNADKIIKYVDFERLRGNLKDRMKTQMEKDASMSPMGKRMVAGLGDIILDNMLRTHVSETGLRKNLEDPQKVKKFDGDIPTGKLTDENTYIVVIKKGKEDMTIILKKYGLFDWKVTDIELPSMRR